MCPDSSQETKLFLSISRHKNESVLSIAENKHIMRPAHISSAAVVPLLASTSAWQMPMNLPVPSSPHITSHSSLPNSYPKQTPQPPRHHKLPEATPISFPTAKDDASYFRKHVPKLSFTFIEILKLKTTSAHRWPVV